MFEWLCRKKINALKADNKRLLEIVADPKILDIEIEQGAISVTMGEHWAIKHMIRSFAESFGPAQNWMALECGPFPTVKGKLLITIQKMGGSTPVEALREKEAEVEKLNAELQEATNEKIKSQSAIQALFANGADEEAWPPGIHYADALGPYVEKLKREIADAERGESDANAVFDNIDKQVSDTLESIGRFPPKPAEWINRIDTLTDTVKSLAAENQKLKLDYHNLVGRASLDGAVMPFYERRIDELLRSLGEVTDMIYGPPESAWPALNRAKALLNQAAKKD